MGICIGRLALSPEFSDIRIVVGQDGEWFPAHKLILAARSEYFRKMFYGAQMREAKENACTFPDDDPAVFRTMLYHIYARPLESTPEPRHIASCLLTSEKYGLDTFRSFCLDTLESLLSMKTACEILSLLEELLQESSIEYTLKILTDKCTKYILENLSSIIHQKSHLHLSESTFQRILQNPFLACNEVELYTAIITWHTHHFENFQVNRELLQKHLSMLDMKLIGLQDMAVVVHPSGVFNPTEMAELYRKRINLQHFNPSRRSERKCALMFHAGSEYSSRPNDVIKSLNMAGLVIEEEDVINFSDTPAVTLNQLMQYSAILVFSMETHSQGMCGDILADYVDNGGCVVLSNALGCIGGKILTDKYLPVKRYEPFEGDFKTYQIGNSRNPHHPLCTGVNKLRVRCGPNFVWNCKAIADTQLIVSWDDDSILACERTCGKGKIVFLNCYPVSTRVVVVGLDKDTDGHILLRNALMYAAYHPCSWSS